MGSKITRLTPARGASAETAGAIVGVGSAKRHSAVRWNVATGILWARVITIPASAMLAAIFYLLASRFV